jgi:hypothetical protein
MLYPWLSLFLIRRLNCNIRRRTLFMWTLRVLSLKGTSGVPSYLFQRDDLLPVAARLERQDDKKRFARKRNPGAAARDVVIMLHAKIAVVVDVRFLFVRGT